MSDSELSLTLTNSSTTHSLNAEVWLDDQQVFAGAVGGHAVDVVCALPEDEAQHQLRIVLKDKLPEHTTISDTGEIIKDALLSIDNAKVDGIGIGRIITDLADYVHDGNGSEPRSSHRFYGSMGCNGETILKFTTPIYLWLREHL